MQFLISFLFLISTPHSHVCTWLRGRIVNKNQHLLLCDIKGWMATTHVGSHRKFPRPFVWPRILLSHMWRVATLGELWGTLQSSSAAVLFWRRRFQSHIVTCPGNTLSASCWDYSQFSQHRRPHIRLSLAPGLLMISLWALNIPPYNILPYTSQILHVIDTLVTVTCTTFIWETVSLKSKRKVEQDSLSNIISFKLLWYS